MVAEQILRLQISVEKILLMHIGKSLQRLVNDVPNEVFWKELLPLFHQLVHIEIQVLKHEVQCVPLKDHLVQLDYVGVR